MPPHLFHAFSDDPSRWERQFGCIAAIFQMFEQHPRTRLFRRRSSSPSPAPVSSSSSSSRRSFSRENTPVASNPSASNSSRTFTLKNNDEVSIASSAETSTSSSSSTLTAITKSKLLRHSKSSDNNNGVENNKHSSPNIFDSSRATAAIREPPRKSVDASTDCTTNSSGAGSRSTPGSPIISRDGNQIKSQNKIQYFDPPRLSVDSSSRRIHESSKREFIRRDENAELGVDVLDDPLQELKESIRALAKLQQATQEFVDTFEAQRQIAQKQSCPISGDGGTPCNRSSFRKCSVLDAPRTSSFDYTEAVRISQKIQEAPAPRLSLDGREVIPKIVLKLREAMRSARSGTQTQSQNSRYGNQALDQSKETSMRSALQAMKEEHDEDDCVSATAKSSVTACTAVSSSSTCSSNRRRSNVIAKLMGLDEIPSEKQSNKTCNVAPRKDQPTSLGDLLSRRKSAKNRISDNQTVQKQLPIDNQAEKGVKSGLVMDDHCLMEAPPPAPAPSPAISVSDRQFNNEFVEEEDDCKEIPEVLNDNNAVINRPCNLNPIKVKPSGNAKHAIAMEVMPCSTTSPKIEKKLHKDNHGCKRPGNSQEEKLGSRRQRSMEIQKTLRRAVAEAVAKQESCVSEKKSLQDIIEAMKRKGLLRGHEASMDESRDFYSIQDVESMEESRIVIIKPRKGRTLSMETQFPADDFPTAEDVKIDRVLTDVKVDGGERRWDNSHSSKRRLRKAEKGNKNNPAAAKCNPVSEKSNPVWEKIIPVSAKSNPMPEKIITVSEKSNQQSVKRNPAQKTRKKVNHREDPSADMATAAAQRPSSLTGDVVKAAVSELSELRDSGHGSLSEIEIEKSESSRDRRKRSLESIKRSIGRQLSASLSNGNEPKNHRKLSINGMLRKSRNSTSIVSDVDVDNGAGRTVALCETAQPLTHESHAWDVDSASEYDSCRRAVSDTGDDCRDMTIITASAGVPSVKCRNGTVPELLSPVSVLDSRYEETADDLPLPYPTQNEYNNPSCKPNDFAHMPEWRPPTDDPEYDYLHMILQAAGVLDVRQFFPTPSATVIDPAVFMQLEWQTETDGRMVKSAVERQKRRLVFDCVREIVDGMVVSDRILCRGRQWLPEGVWRELEKLRKVSLNLAQVHSKGDGFVESLVERDLEQSEWKFWCPANLNAIAVVGDSPTAQIASNLADSIFQDLLLEVVHMETK